ncbi:hypothetical protein TSAR_010200 [Trichomalopsis sarcophagae]|uniref:Uncharacterized protein n=1 Tax=Trichomalopsis sarcophagae TaxID=543379 RepID=A0A232EIJ2_9HYME|nr:hypothetical protein TSAR_010200 [Trichomalopsis sarcophagae]
MNLLVNEIQEIIVGTGQGTRVEEQGFRTPQPCIRRSVEEAGNSKSTRTERRAKRGGGRGGCRIGNKLKQRKLEDSLKSKEETGVKRKQRSTLEQEEKNKKERAGEEEVNEYAFAKGGNVKRTPQEKEKMEDETTGSLKNTIDRSLQKVEEISIKMDKEKEEREDDGELGTEISKTGRKYEQENRGKEGILKYVGERRKRVRRECKEAGEREEKERETEKKDWEMRLEQEKKERREDLKKIIERGKMGQEVSWRLVKEKTRGRGYAEENVVIERKNKKNRGGM